MMEVVQNGEISMMDNSTDIKTEVKRDVQGILIKDPSLEPYNIQFDYTGFKVLRDGKKLLGPTGMNECLTDVYKRQMADNNTVMTLKEFTEFSTKRSQEIMKAQGAPDNYQEMMKKEGKV